MFGGLEEPTIFDRPITECSHNIDGIICLDENGINEIKKKLKLDINMPDEKVIKKAIEETSCDGQLCVSKVLKLKNQEENFKPFGPTDKDTWFSNFNIDQVLSQFEKKYPFAKHIKFQMRDFEKYDTELSNLDIIKEYNKNKTCFCVVLNDDYTRGRGTHWTSIFIDMRKKPFTIEHFNSSGAGPKNEFREWMWKQKHKLDKQFSDKDEISKVIEVSKIAHQQDSSSCGPYSVFYIISRLENVPYEYFLKIKIDDKNMHKLREILLNKE